MTIRGQILSFLRDPQAFGRLADDPDIWREALEDFAVPGLARHNDYPLRPAQIDAWLGLVEQRAGLILGPPGTGKTHLLAWLILGYVQARRRRGLRARVFVTAFTRNAIGNLLDTVARQADVHCADLFDTHFFGTPPANGLDASIQQIGYLGNGGADDALDVLDCDAVVAGGSVWSLFRLLDASTTGDRFTSDLFDLVCIDEASQMVVSQGLMAMGGLREDGRLIVAGDDRQLPPIRASREIKLEERQIGGSLYAFLKSGGLPEYALDETFRLNQPLASFPEKKFYPGVYRSAMPDRTLTLVPDWQAGLEDWERDVLDPAFPVSIVLYNGPIAATSNPFEARLAASLANKLADRMIGGKDGREASPQFWSERLAIVSPHRAQNANIRAALASDLRAGCFVETVDRIQGKERDVVLLSYTVADTEFATAEADFIFSSERLNVAITRAKTKLIVLLSRSLLEAIPSDQEQMDKAEILREFVFDAPAHRRLTMQDGHGGTARVEIRRKGFANGEPVDDIAIEDPDPIEPLILPEHLADLLETVKRVALRTQQGSASERELARAHATTENLFPHLSQLFAFGCINLYEGAKDFWLAKPIEPWRNMLAADFETVLRELANVIDDERKGLLPPFYTSIRTRFAWIDEDRGDRLKPILDLLQRQGLVVYGVSNGNLTVDWRQDDAPAPDIPALDLPDLSDDDFRILNGLEDFEASRINFGVVEAWTSTAMLADELGRNRTEIANAVTRLLAHGWVMSASEGRIRTRMAELARELRYVKQRFGKDDTDRRPYLVRSLKVELRDRDKPKPTEKLADVFDRVDCGPLDAHRSALSGLKRALIELWGANAKLAGFQRRSFEALHAGWIGSEGGAFAIAADTGSGKTEAALLPLIAAAGGDALAGARGTSAILAYPRIRLATNQAQRLVRYLACFARQDGMPCLSAGLQLTGVPETFRELKKWDERAGWKELGSAHFLFPFFKCPECSTDLHLHVGEGVNGFDRLACVECSFAFDGWAGSKAKIRSEPPTFFLPTTDSLHQWMHDTRAGRIFGDDAAYGAPRALVADEIHLYSHIHGAQVGYTFRRLAARAQQNPDTGMLLIGMSATLGDPKRVWGDLVGRKDVDLITPLPAEKEINPRGREYFFFVQPEVESRGYDVAGASTSIQAIMCLAHGMRRRTGKQGGFRSIVFLDSIDKLRRLHAAFTNAEDNRLASFRTTRYPDNPLTGARRDRCCGQPHGCDIFRKGECWHFAATDDGQMQASGRSRKGSRLVVARQPIHSGAKGAVEQAIKGSDIVFATSSLEVGYDDPDITMVYQHYAPSNLASFIQRKGRGGRGSDDRPITGVTLSIYSSRDTWWFRRPRMMLEPASLSTPLNPSNHFVRRGQLVAAILDGFAIYQRRSGRSVSLAAPANAAFRTANDLVTAVFGSQPWEEFGVADIVEFWSRVRGQNRDLETVQYASEFRERCDWIPNLLFETGDGPHLRLVCGGQALGDRHDIALAMMSLAPGNGSRRYDGLDVHWRVPIDGTAPWCDPEDYRIAPPTDLDDPGSYLPDDVVAALPNLQPNYFRPRQITVQLLGRMNGTTCQSRWMIQQGAVVPAPDGAPQDIRVRHDSQASLRGFPILKVEAQKAQVIAVEPEASWLGRAEAFIGSSTSRGTTGLAVANVFWAADAEVKAEGPNIQPLSMTQFFTVPGRTDPVLHGYHFHPEGVTFAVKDDRLDRFVDRIIDGFEDDPSARRWHGSQMARFLIEKRALAYGVNAYHANRAAELIFSAVASEEVRKDLRGLLRFWSPQDLAAIFETIRTDLLSEHPLLTRDRVADTAARLGDIRFQPLIREAIGAVGNRDLLHRYLKSTVLHSLAIRLKDAFALASGGDAAALMFHARLPIQFEEAGEAKITIFETTSHGDGTTRTFVERYSDFRDLAADGFLDRCPNAAEDRAIDRFFELSDHHAAWRDIDPTNRTRLMDVAEMLGLEDLTLPNAVPRILFHSETIGAERIAIFDIATEVRQVEARLTRAFGRAPATWELASGVVRHAQSDQQSVAGKMLLAYAQIEGAALDGSFSPESRLADQVLRLGMKLCPDGCRACTHQGSDLMGDSLVQSSTSRMLLSDFLCDAV